MGDKIFSNHALSNLIKEKILKDIILGKLLPGEKLIEAQYAKEYGTSRAPVREAFYLLTLEGIVKKIPRKGTIVKGFSSEESKDLLEIRCFLEDLSLEKLRNKNYSKFLKEMTNIIKNMKSLKESNKYAELNFQFHNQLILASDSEILRTYYSRLGNILLSLQSVAFMKEDDIKKSIAEHELLVKHLSLNDIDKAKELLTQHNRSVFERVEKNKRGMMVSIQRK